MSMLKKINVICFMVLFPFIALAQQGNSGNDTTKIFTPQNTFVRTTEQLVLSIPADNKVHNRQILLQGVRIKNKRVLILHVYSGSSDLLEIGKTCKISFRLTDNSFVRLFNDTPAKSVYKSNFYGSYITANYNLSANDEFKLINSTVVNMQIDFNGGVYNFNLKSDEAANCKRVFLLIK